MGGVRERSKVTQGVVGAVLSDTPTQHLLRTRENLNEIHGYSTIVHSHTRTQRPQMTSRDFFFKGQSRKKCLESTQNSQGHTLQAKRTSFLNNAHLRKVGGKHCKHMASTYKHMGKLQSAILRRESKFGSNFFLVSGHSACPCERCGLKCFPEL